MKRPSSEEAGAGWLHGGRESKRALKQSQQHRPDDIVIYGYDKLHWGDEGWPTAKSCIGEWVAAPEHWSRLRTLMKKNLANGDAPLPSSATVGVCTSAATPPILHLRMKTAPPAPPIHVSVATDSMTPAAEVRPM